jgi:hypothetical protein
LSGGAHTPSSRCHYEGISLAATDNSVRLTQGLHRRFANSLFRQGEYADAMSHFSLSAASPLDVLHVSAPTPSPSLCVSPPLAHLFAQCESPPPSSSLDAILTRIPALSSCTPSSAAAAGGALRTGSSPSPLSLSLSLLTAACLPPHSDTGAGHAVGEEALAAAVGALLPYLMAHRHPAETARGKISRSLSEGPCPIHAGASGELRTQMPCAWCGPDTRHASRTRSAEVAFPGGGGGGGGGRGGGRDRLGGGISLRGALQQSMVFWQRYRQKGSTGAGLKAGAFLPPVTHQVHSQYHMVSWGLFEGEGLSTSRVSPPGHSPSLSLSLSLPHTLAMRHTLSLRWRRRRWTRRFCARSSCPAPRLRPPRSPSSTHRIACHSLGTYAHKSIA